MVHVKEPNHTPKKWRNQGQPLTQPMPDGELLATIRRAIVEELQPLKATLTRVEQEVKCHAVVSHLREHTDLMSLSSVPK